MTESNDTVVRWPTSSDYSQAVQSPDVALVAEPLRGLEPVYGVMGVPLSASGQNAIVFLLSSSAGQQFALRCFTTPASSAQPRYEALNDYVGDRHRGWLAASEWVPDGIVVSNRKWPVVLMPWISGRPMNVAVIDALEDGPEQLDQLVANWGAIVANLEGSGIAHGDLQHGNILVDDTSAMKLVDLDGIWLPQVGLTAPNEIGHPNYQHPQRSTDHWGRYVDTFSALVIDVGLRALRADPDLADRSGGENLLLTKLDLADPQSSDTFARLGTSSDPVVVARAERLAELCRSPIRLSLVPFAQVVDRQHALGGGVTPTADVDAGSVNPGSAGALPIGAVPVATSAEGNWWEDPVPTEADHPADTVLVGRSPTSPPDEALRQESSSEVRSSGAHVPPANTADVPTVSSARTTAGGTKGGGLGLGSASAGALGGFIAGWVATVVYALVRGSIDPDLQAGVFVLLVAPLLGFFVLAIQSLFIGRIGRGLGRGLLGGCVATAAAGLGIAIADPLFDSIVADRAVTSAMAVWVSALVWSILASLIGFGLGALQSIRASLIGFVVGANAGAIGGLVFGAAAEIERSSLVIDPGEPATVASVALVSVLIGASVGGARRVGAAGVARVIEGPSTGLEVLMRRRLVIGSADDSDLRISGLGVEAEHATIIRSADGPVVVVRFPVDIDGVERPPGEYPLGSGSVLRIGSAFIRFTSRDEAKR